MEEVKRIHAQNYGVYGHRKMWHAMRREGWMIGRDQTARLMKTARLHGVRRGRRPFTTIASKAPDRRPDLVERDFHALAPNLLWVADISYVRTAGGFAYTAFITDACTRKIVGWSVASSLTTQALPMIALQQRSPRHRRPTGPVDWCITAIAESGQYVSLAYTDTLAEHGVAPSVGTVGDSYDNALAEPVNGLYKAELIYSRTTWPSTSAVEFGNTGVGELVEPPAPARSTRLPHPGRGRSGLRSSPDESSRHHISAERNPGRFTPAAFRFDHLLGERWHAVRDALQRLQDQLGEQRWVRPAFERHQDLLQEGNCDEHLAHNHHSRAHQLN